MLFPCIVVCLLALLLWGISFTSFENFLHPVRLDVPVIF